MLARGAQGLLDACAVPPVEKQAPAKEKDAPGGAWVCEQCSLNEWDGRKLVCPRCKAPRTNGPYFPLPLRIIRFNHPLPVICAVPKKAPRRIGNNFRFQAKWKRSCARCVATSDREPTRVTTRRFETEVMVPAGHQVLLLCTSLSVLEPALYVAGLPFTQLTPSGPSLGADP
jgi:hypothetical protein